VGPGILLNGGSREEIFKWKEKKKIFRNSSAKVKISRPKDRMERVGRNQEMKSEIMLKPVLSSKRGDMTSSQNRRSTE
jgi:hypothetical protein